MIQLIVSDMDGTLLNHKLEVSKVNQEAIQAAQQRGIRFMVATGRGYTEAVPSLHEAGIHCPMITVNGGQIYDENGTLERSIGIDKARIRSILQFVKEKGLYAELVLKSGVYSENKVRRIETMTTLLQNTNPDTTFKMALILAMGRMELLNIHYVEDYEELLNDDREEVLKVLIFSNIGQPELEPVRQHFEQDDELAITSSFFNNIEINHVEAQKGIALEHVANELGIPLENVMAIGDNYNDVSMLEKAGVSFAMGNAEPGVKAVAKYETKTNTEDGVGLAILRCINDNL
ncbi:Cof-type HAD-IIB family hydrolase [Jeotgalibaca caeni]|uniref:Cof-type HAD-IIB family hydrolase n=1 Tax=Jeotgalibaca caeni TaxID=3028623 RepID=UPI00237E9ACF|nr:Cof-type HAD-IIB family hydrolase [Jeotgalibaca caeni]MDE1549038.1 Cof-type HAD-IIB family hydrolase [Jeotgalibaca caeni]